MLFYAKMSITQYWIVMAMMLIDCKIMIACSMQKRSEGKAWSILNDVSVYLGV